MKFFPPRCPRPDCPAHQQGASFQWRRRGHYTRKCDGRRVPRFQCLRCERSFSSQAFRFDYRLHLPRLHARVFDLMVSKVTMRQIARVLGVSRRTIGDRLIRMGAHTRSLHEALLARATRARGLRGRFLMDELETYEGDRRLRPVTVPVLIEAESFYVVGVETGPMPSRGRLTRVHRQRRDEMETREGRRANGSGRAVRRCFSRLLRACDARSHVEIGTDQKLSYGIILRELFGGRLTHVRTSSRLRRDRRNPLFRINHTLAMLRDGVSRLVRRTWAASKKHSRLELHLWIWVAYRNYVRCRTVKEPGLTPAMAVGVLPVVWGAREVFRYKAEHLDLHRDH